MNEILTASPLILAAAGIVAFIFAVVMQPIFVWIICARMKATNATLKRMEKLLVPCK